MLWRPIATDSYWVYVCLLYTSSTLISYAGGFDADSYTRSLRVVRQNGQEYEVNTVKDLDYSVYKMRNGDVVTAEALSLIHI